MPGFVVLSWRRARIRPCRPQTATPRPRRAAPAGRSPRRARRQRPRASRDGSASSEDGRRRRRRRPRCRAASSASTTRAPAAPSTLRSSACAQTAPNIVTLAPSTTTGLFLSAASARGREAQSTAFLITPGIEPLYSGVAISRPSAPAISSRSRATRLGDLGLEVLVEVRQRAQRVGLEDLDLGPARVEARLRRGLEQAPCYGSRSGGCRRSPGPASLLRLLDELERDGQRDLVTEHLGAVRQVHVPAEAELVAVDRPPRGRPRRRCCRRGSAPGPERLPFAVTELASDRGS